MRRSLIFYSLIIALMITSYNNVSAETITKPIQTSSAVNNSGLPQDQARGLDISLRTPLDSSITYRSERETPQNNDDAVKEIPHLVLKRNGFLTPSFERTLLVSVEEFVIPRSGLYLDLVIHTQHSDPNLGEKMGSQLTVWHEARFIPYTNQTTKPVSFTVQFSQSHLLNAPNVQTPTDYYAYRLTLISARGEILQTIEEEYAFLLENQWIIPLPEVLEASPGAAPSQLLLYYCDMFPFQRDMRDPLTRLKRDEVERYIQAVLTPALVEAFETQSKLWNFPWYLEWKNYRSEDGPKTLSVALGEYQTWYHGTSLFLGNAMISIRVDGPYGGYSTLTDGILGVFHHELFHNLQRNIILHFDDNENLSGKDNAWKMFSEGTAVLASAVGQPHVEFEATLHPRNYVQRVKAYLGQEGISNGGLSESYTEIPYHTALFWRFLYENCGGLVNGKENPSTGMEVIQKVLEILYQGDVVDIQTSSDTAKYLPMIVELALNQTPACEFRTYKEVLLRFSEAVFLLRTQNGRCDTYIDYRICGFFDPYHLYPTPNAETYSIPASSELLIEGAIQSSYGIDLIELNLDQVRKQKTLKITLGDVSTINEEFCIAVMRIHRIYSPLRTVAISAGESESTCIKGGSIELEINPMHQSQLGDIGIVISRSDSFEQIANGEYFLQIQAE